MIRLNLDIKKTENDNGKKILTVYTDQIFMDYLESEIEGKNPIDQPYLFNVEPHGEEIITFDDLFKRMKNISNRNEKYDNGMEVYIDGSLFGIKENKLDNFTYNKDFSRDIVKKYSLSPEINLTTEKKKGLNVINNVIKIGVNTIDLYNKFETMDEIKEQTKKDLKLSLVGSVIDNYKITLNNKKFLSIRDNEINSVTTIKKENKNNKGNRLSQKKLP